MTDLSRMDVPTPGGFARGIEPRRPSKKIVEFWVCTKSAKNACGWQVGRFVSGWWREVVENANNRAEATGLNIYEIGPTVRNVGRTISLSPDAVFIVHRYREENGPEIHDEWPSSYDDAKIARIESRRPPSDDGDDG